MRFVCFSCRDERILPGLVNMVYHMCRYFVGCSHNDFGWNVRLAHEGLLLSREDVEVESNILVHENCVPVLSQWS